MSLHGFVINETHDDNDAFWPWVPVANCCSPVLSPSPNVSTSHYQYCLVYYYIILLHLLWCVIQNIHVSRSFDYAV